jgi:hypothetical protein
MNWKFFIGASILVTGLLIKVGAPLFSIVLGIAEAGFLTYQRSTRHAKR